MVLSSNVSHLLLGPGVQRIGQHERAHAGRPALAAMRWARASNSWVTTTTAVFPLEATATVSWTLQEVQDPQLPRPTTAMSTSVANASSSCRVRSPSSPTRFPEIHRRTSAPLASSSGCHSSMTHSNDRHVRSERNPTTLPARCPASGPGAGSVSGAGAVGSGS